MDPTLAHGIEQLHGESFGWALACCGWNRIEAKDVLQTAYLKVLDRRARFDGRSRLKTWLFAVIRRTAADSRRRSLVWSRASSGCGLVEHSQLRRMVTRGPSLAGP